VRQVRVGELECCVVVVPFRARPPCDDEFSSASCADDVVTSVRRTKRRTRMNENENGPTLVQPYNLKEGRAGQEFITNELLGRAFVP
jgi:hypothetical protein